MAAILTFLTTPCSQPGGKGRFLEVCNIQQPNQSQLRCLLNFCSLAFAALGVATGRGSRIHFLTVSVAKWGLFPKPFLLFPPAANYCISTAPFLLWSLSGLASGIPDA